MQVKLLIYGVIQGVGFRPFIYRIAHKLNLKGYVKNTSSHVEIVLDGNKKKIEAFLTHLKAHPPIISIKDVELKEGDYGDFKEFRIIKSSFTQRTLITIPPDIGVCNNCLKELRNEANPRHNYWFITCTNCGPRFTITKQLPYDRKNTTMANFNMCKLCESEYKDPLNRRYHAQTVACPNCGPNLILYDNHFNKIYSTNPISEVATLLQKGKIIAIKGIGGFHIAALSTDDETIKELRKRKNRKEKPFAIMAPSIKIIKSFAILNKLEEQLLVSWQRPIVLLKKSQNYWLSELIAPKLHNIGVMLPYTALHYLLFDFIEEPIIMTSANKTSEPTIITEKDASTKLTNIVDYFLIHTRPIHQRCDDSVIRVINHKKAFLRYSRGYIPTYLDIGLTNKNILALGAEQDNTFTIYTLGKAYLSPYIGNTANYDTFISLKHTLKKFQHLLNINKFDLVMCDLHPEFNTTKLAEKFSKPLIKVQHHFAHLAACMAEHQLTKAIGIICDGYGYGLDNNAWGGEILLLQRKKLKRIAHLEYQPLIGGDIATLEPLRIVVGILSKFLDLKEIKKYVPLEKVKIWCNQLSNNFNITLSSSCGRFLDAISAYLNICTKRTYEGEPAIKLESVAYKGKRLIDLPIKITSHDEEKVIYTTPIFETLITLKEKPEDIALSVHYAIAKAFAKIVKPYKIPICFAGGVAYNELINSFLKNQIEFYVQESTPRGDGSISLGQIYINKFLDTVHQ